MRLGVANLEGHSACVREADIDKKRETERNDGPHVGQGNERRLAGEREGDGR